MDAETGKSIFNVTARCRMKLTELLHNYTQIYSILDSNRSWKHVGGGAGGLNGLGEVMNMFSYLEVVIDQIKVDNK